MDLDDQVVHLYEVSGSRWRWMGVDLLASVSRAAQRQDGDTCMATRHVEDAHGGRFIDAV